MKTAVLIDLENVVASLENMYGSKVEADTGVNWKKFFEYLNTMGYDVVIAKAFVNPYRVGRPHVANNLSRMGIRVILTNSTKIGNNIKTLTDSVMIVEGMSILYERPAVEALVIVSGDKDFLPLAEKARELGREVIFASFSNSMASMIKERFQVIDLLEFSILNETFDSHIYSNVEEITV